MSNDLDTMKLPKETVNKAREIVKTTKHTLSGFVVLAIEEKIERILAEQKKDGNLVRSPSFKK